MPKYLIFGLDRRRRVATFGVKCANSRQNSLINGNFSGDRLRMHWVPSQSLWPLLPGYDLPAFTLAGARATAN